MVTIKYHECNNDLKSTDELNKNLVFDRNQHILSNFVHTLLTNSKYDF